LFAQHYSDLFGVIIGQIGLWLTEHSIKQPLKTSGESSVPHLLVVDDDLDLCEVLESYLRAEDFAVSFAHSGVEGTKWELTELSN
jgi:hypothetical protein